MLKFYSLLRFSDLWLGILIISRLLTGYKTCRILLASSVYDNFPTIVKKYPSTSWHQVFNEFSPLQQNLRRKQTIQTQKTSPNCRRKVLSSASLDNENCLDLFFGCLKKNQRQLLNSGSLFIRRSFFSVDRNLYS